MEAIGQEEVLVLVLANRRSGNGRNWGTISGRVDAEIYMGGRG